jgi:hypothetical protein
MQLAELNSLKSLYFVNLGVVFLSLVLLLLMPSHSSMGEIYLYFLLGGIAFVIADIVLVGEVFEFHNTVTVDEDLHPQGEKMFLLQNILPFKWCVIVAIIFGLFLGVFYFNAYTTQGVAYISVPKLFSVSPYFITVQLFDVWVTSFVVGNVEELVWIGVMFPLIWMGFAFVLSRFVSFRLPAFFVAMIIACLLTGWLSSWVFHMFVYGGNLYAYSSGQFHFTTTALIAGLTGTIVGGVVAHFIHNATVTGQQYSQPFAVVPLQAYQGGS